MDTNCRVVLGFQGLEFNTGLDKATSGNLTFILKDHPTNADRHALLLGQLIKSDLVLSIEDGKFSVSVREKDNGTPQ